MKVFVFKIYCHLLSCNKLLEFFSQMLTTAPTTLQELLARRLTWTMVSRFCRDVDAVLMTDVGPMVTTVT